MGTGTDEKAKTYKITSKSGDEIVLTIGDVVICDGHYVSDSFEGTATFQGPSRNGSGYIALERHDGICGGAQYGWWSFDTNGIQYLKIVSKKEMPKKAEKVVDFKALESLVIDKTAKDEIMAVLKQHNNSEKLFEEWGLGEVLEYGKGMSFLFYGPPGTGKTWGANCIAKAIGTTMLSIGAGEIQSQEPGAANRNITEAFSTAKKKGQILFIDECDSLICNRDGLGMVLSSEVNTLLTEIEKSEGIVILATNRIENMDPALERRISLIVEFPEPDYEQRKEIWKRLLPKKMPLHKNVDIAKLAEEVLTGGQIKNIVLQAARLAISEESKEVKPIHFQAAIKRVRASKNLMGTASRYSQHLGPDVGIAKVGSFIKKIREKTDVRIDKTESER